MFSKMGFVHQRDIKNEFDVLQGGFLSPKLFTEFLQDISKSYMYLTNAIRQNVTTSTTVIK